LLYLELARRQRGWTQKELGDHPRVRVHQTLISMIERGDALPVPDQLDRLAKALDLPATKLLERVEAEDIRRAFGDAAAAR
jgi:transcriptional regulator with XRE-family HTH domain